MAITSSSLFGGFCQNHLLASIYIYVLFIFKKQAMQKQLRALERLIIEEVAGRQVSFAKHRSIFLLQRHQAIMMT